MELADRPVIPAGGLTLRRTILDVRPAGVDSHTGVEDVTGRNRISARTNGERESFAAITNNKSFDPLFQFRSLITPKEIDGPQGIGS